MQLENLYHTKFNSPPGTTDAHILAVMMVEEQRRTYIFLLTEWQQAGNAVISLWQYTPAEKMIGPVCGGIHPLAVKWLEQFGRVFEEARYPQVNINIVECEDMPDTGESSLLCGARQILADGAAIFYMGQDIFGMSCHRNPEESFGGLHYNDEFTLKIQNAHMDAGMLGICVDDTEVEGVHYLAYCAEAAYRLKHTTMKYLTIKDLRQPFQLMEFIIKSADPDMNVEIQDYDRQKVGRRFLGARKIHNILLEKEEELYIGDVTITRSISLQGELPKEFQLHGEHGAYMWVKVTAETLYEAYEKIREELECAAGILNLLVKNDTFLPLYGKNQKMLGWHYPFHENIVYVGRGIYLENCDTAENMYYGGEDDRKNVIRLETSIRRYLEDDNELDAMFNLFVDGEKQDVFLLMLRWFEAGCAADELDEKIIYLDMALEFAMSGEQGTSFLAARGVTEATQKELLEQLAVNLEGILPEEELRKAVAGQIENTLVKNTSFISKLERFVKEEQLAVSPVEIELIKKMRKKRNAIAHGKRNVKFSKRETEKVTGVISNILLAKVYKVVRENERNR